MCSLCIYSQTKMQSTYKEGKHYKKNLYKKVWTIFEPSFFL